MAEERLIVVEEAFVARGKGVLVFPRITTSTPPRGSFGVHLRRPDGTARDALAEMEVAHMRGALPPYAMYRLLDVTAAEVPPGTEIWSR